jgi:hypothetical protein
VAGMGIGEGREGEGEEGHKDERRFDGHAGVPFDCDSGVVRIVARVRGCAKGMQKEGLKGRTNGTCGAAAVGRGRLSNHSKIEIFSFERIGGKHLGIFCVEAS